MIGYGTEKIILKFQPFCQLNEENQERENSKSITLYTTTQNYTSQVRSNWELTGKCLFVFLFSFEFPSLEVPRSKFRKAVISK